MESKVANGVYHSPTPGKIPIVALKPYLNQEHENWPLEYYEKVFSELNQCGFNVFNVFPSYSFIRKILTAAEEYNLKVLLGHSYLRSDYSIDKEGPVTEEDLQKCHQFVTQYQNEKMLGGWWFKDQPYLSQLSPESKLYKMYEYIKELDPNHLIFINLSGNSGNYAGDNYDEYVSQYQNVYHPSFFCYGAYAIFKNCCDYEPDLDYFYRDLEKFSTLSKTTGRPFWVQLQSMAWCNESMSYVHPAATLATLRFQVFASLAYGAKGICYYNYHLLTGQPSSSPNYSTQRFNALVDLEDNKMPAWFYAKTINEEIQRYTDVFLDSELVKCIQFTKDDASFGGNVSDSKDSFIPGTIDGSVSVGALSNVRSSYKGVQISHLRNKTDNYIVIVNRDLNNFQSLTLRFINGTKVYQLTPNDSGGEVNAEHPIFFIPSIGITRTLTPGGYMIFKYE